MNLMDSLLRLGFSAKYLSGDFNTKTFVIVSYLLENFKIKIFLHYNLSESFLGLKETKTKTYRLIFSNN